MHIQPFSNITFPLPSLIRSLSETTIKVTLVAVAALAAFILLVVLLRSHRKIQPELIQKPIQRKQDLSSTTKSNRNEMLSEEKVKTTSTPNSSMKGNLKAKQNLQEHSSDPLLRKGDKAASELKQSTVVIKNKQEEIKKLQQIIASLSQGNFEKEVWNLTFKANQLVLDESNECYIPAQDISGEMFHSANFDKKFHVVEENALKNLKISDYKEGILVVKGCQIKEFKLIAQGDTNRYQFTTLWKGNGVFPSIKVIWVTANIHYNQPKISLLEKTLVKAKQELQKLLT